MSDKALVQFIDKEQLTTIQDYAKYLADGRALPVGIDNAAKLAMILHAGKDLGMSATQALSGITLVNGKPVVWGAVAASLMTANGYKLEWLEATSAKAKLKVSKEGRGEHVEEFTIEDAKKAGLSTKAGPWTLYPKDMLRWKALARARNFFCPEVGAGMPVAEDYRDNDEAAIPEGPSELQQQVEAAETLEELAKFAGKVHADKPAYEAYVKRKKDLTAKTKKPKEEVVEAKVEEEAPNKEAPGAIEEARAKNGKKLQAFKETGEWSKDDAEKAPEKEEPKQEEPKEEPKQPAMTITGDETLTAARDAERTAKKRAKGVDLQKISTEWYRDDLPEATKEKRSETQLAIVLNHVTGRTVSNLYDLTPTEAQVLLSALIWRNNEALKKA